MSRAVRLLVTGALALGMWVPLGSVPPAGAAPTAPTSVVTIIGEHYDWVTSGGDYVWRTGGSLPSDDTMWVTRAQNGIVTVRLSTGEDGPDASMDFAAPTGQELTPGVYDNAERAAFRSGDHPGIDIDIEGHGCNATAGRFIVYDAPADLSRLWMTFEQSCGGERRLFGEVRYNEPNEDPDLLVAPARLRWPDTYPNASRRQVPIVLVNTGTTPVHVESATITGDHADFSVLDNPCATIAVGATCRIYVEFRPTGPGPRSATLNIEDSTALGAHTVALSGTGMSGNTSWEAASEGPGDRVGAGHHFAYWPGDAVIYASGNSSWVNMGVQADNGDEWNMDVIAPTGRKLTAGSTYDIEARMPDNWDAAGLQADVNGNGCTTDRGWFTVDQATYDEDDRVQSFAVHFHQYCRGLEPGLVGTMAWRAQNPAKPLPAYDSAPAQSSIVRLTRSRAALVYGRASVLNGRVLDSATSTGVTGARVRVQARPSGSTWHTVATRTAGARGAFKVAVRPARRTEYRALFGGAAGHAAAASKVLTVNVAPAVTVSTRRAARSAVLLRARVGPSLAGKRVWLERRTRAKWKHLKAARLTRASVTTFRVAGAKRGAVYRVTVPVTPGHTAGHSRALRLR